MPSRVERLVAVLRDERRWQVPVGREEIAIDAYRGIQPPQERHHVRARGRGVQVDRNFRVSRERGRESRVELAVRLHDRRTARSEEHTSELQSQFHLVCRLLLEKKKKTT